MRQKLQGGFRDQVHAILHELESDFTRRELPGYVKNTQYHAFKGMTLSPSSH